jgi:hypothetical protein
MSRPASQNLGSPAMQGQSRDYEHSIIKKGAQDRELANTNICIMFLRNRERVLQIREMKMWLLCP